MSALASAFVRLAGPVMALGLCAATPVLAAKIEVLETAALTLDRLAAGHCSLSLSGPIEAGDAAKLQEIFEESELRLYWPVTLLVADGGGEARAHSICLNSRGGSFAEGIRLAETLIDFGIVASVPEGAECLSACAVAFMGGSSLSKDSGGGSRMPFRVLHIGGRLGFHAPYVDFSRLGKTVPPAVAENAFRTALSTMALITEALEGHDTYQATDRFPKALLLQMLDNYGPTAFHYVETVDQAGLYDIRLAGVPPVTMDDEAWLRLCSNMVDWSRGNAASSVDPPLGSWGYELFLGPRVNARLTELPDELIMLGAGEVAGPKDITAQVLARHQECTIYWHSEEMAGSEFSVYFKTNTEFGQLRFRPAWGWASLPHFTRFADLAGETVIPQELLTIRYGAADGLLDALIEAPLPGFSLIADERDGIFDVIYLGPDGLAWASLSGQAAEEVPYRINGQEVCLTVVDETTPEEPRKSTDLCLRIGREGAQRVTLSGPIPEQPLLFQRWGDATRTPRPQE